MFDRQIDPSEPKFYAYDFQKREIYQGEQAVYRDPVTRKLIRLEMHSLDEVKAYLAEYYIEAGTFLDEQLYFENEDDRTLITAGMFLETIREDWDEVNTNA